MEVVVAVIFLILSNGNLEMKATSKMPLDDCISQARELNADDTHPYLMLCGPDLSVATHAS